MMASCRDLSVSSINCSDPPLIIMVQVLASEQPVNKLNLQTPETKNDSQRLKKILNFGDDL